jgi:hypothetical protein
LKTVGQEPHEGIVHPHEGIVQGIAHVGILGVDTRGRIVVQRVYKLKPKEKANDYVPSW